jgi:hypothetical protein
MSRMVHRSQRVVAGAALFAARVVNVAGGVVEVAIE